MPSGQAETEGVVNVPVVMKAAVVQSPPPEVVVINPPQRVHQVHPPSASKRKRPVMTRGGKRRGGTRQASQIPVPDRAVTPTLTRRVPAATATIPDRLAHRRTRQAQGQVPTQTRHQVPTALQEGQERRGAAPQQEIRRRLPSRLRAVVMEGAVG